MGSRKAEGKEMGQKTVREKHEGAMWNRECVSQRVSEPFAHLSPSLLHFPSDKQPEQSRLLWWDSRQTYTGSGECVRLCMCVCVWLRAQRLAFINERPSRSLIDWLNDTAHLNAVFMWTCYCVHSLQTHLTAGGKDLGLDLERMASCNDLIRTIYIWLFLIIIYIIYST